MKNKILAGFAAVMLIGLMAFVAVAYRGNPGVESPNYNEDVHAELEAAMVEGDYDAWLKIRQDNNLPTEGKIYRVINRDNFDKYVELHNANLAGDIEKADAIRAELGLGLGSRGEGAHRGGGAGVNGWSSGCDGGCTGGQHSEIGAAGCDGSCANHQI